MTTAAERRARLASQGIRPEQIDAMVEILAAKAPGYVHTPSRRPAWDAPAPQLPARLRVELTPYE